MALQNRTRLNSAYGIDNALQALAPAPIRAQRAPNGNDTGPIGQIWIDIPSNLAYILTSITSGQANWQLLEASGGAGVFTSLLVNPGPVTTQGTGAVNISADAVNTTINVGTGAGVKAVTIGSLHTTSSTIINGGNSASAIELVTNSGTSEVISITNTLGTAVAAINMTAEAGGVALAGFSQANLSAPIIYVDEANGVAATVHIGDGTGAARTVTVGSTDTTSSTVIQAGSGAIGLVAGGLVSVVPDVNTIASPTATVTLDANVIRVIWTGFSTASSGVQAFTIVSSQILATSGIFVSATCATTGALLTVTGVQQLVGSIVITLTNNGGSAVADNIVTTVWIIS